jgi:hypothetical protein
MLYYEPHNKLIYCRPYRDYTEFINLVENLEFRSINVYSRNTYVSNRLPQLRHYCNYLVHTTLTSGDGRQESGT